MKLSEICSKGKFSLRQKDVFDDGPYTVYGASGIVGTMSVYQNEAPYVAVVKDGAGVGRANACEPMTSVLGTMQALIPNSDVDRDYLLHLVRSLHLGRGFSGSTIPHIYFRDYGKIEVPLPSIDVQKRIVFELGSVEAQIAQAEAQIKQLDSLVKSRFVEMFESKDYGMRPMGDLVESITAGTNVGGQQRPLREGEYGVLKISAVTQGVFNPGEFKVVNDVSHIKMIHPRKGDLLFSRANTSEMVGATAIVDKDYGDLFLPDKLWRLDPTDEVETVFLKALLSSPSIRAEMSKVSTGSSGSMQNISMAKFRKLPAFLPPLALQQEFAAFASQVNKSRFVDLGGEGQVRFLIANRWDEDRQPFHILLVNTCLANSSLGICFKIAFREFGSHLGAQECRNHESLIRMKTHHIRLENRHFWNMRNKHCFTHAANTVDSVNNNVILVDAVTSALAFVAIEPFQRTVVRTFVPE